MPLHAVVFCIHPQWASCHSPIHSYPSAPTQSLWGWAPCVISSIILIKEMLFPQEVFVLALIIPVILEKTSEWLLSQCGQSRSRRWSWWKGWKCLDWLYCWRKHNLYLVISLVLGHFLKFLLIHHLLLAPEQRQGHLVFRFSAHSSISLGTWMK